MVRSWRRCSGEGCGDLEWKTCVGMCSLPAPTLTGRRGLLLLAVTAMPWSRVFYLATTPPSKSRLFFFPNVLLAVSFRRERDLPIPFSEPLDLVVAKYCFRCIRLWLRLAFRITCTMNTNGGRRSFSRRKSTLTVNGTRWSTAAFCVCSL